MEKDIEKLNKAKENAIKIEAYEKAGEIKKKQEKKREKIEKLMAKWEKDKQNNRPRVGENEIADIISGWTKIPVKTLEEGEAHRLRQLEEILHKRVIGQEEAVTALAKAIRRGRVEIKSTETPHWFFLIFRSHRCRKDRAF